MYEAEGGMTNLEKILDDSIRKIPDFPKEGILFYDITSILLNPKVYGLVIDAMEHLYEDESVDGIIAAESRGFLFAGPLALKKGVPLILARKKGKLPGATWSSEYKLEYGTATIEIHRDDLKKGERYLIVDDLVATGGTLKAIASIVESAEATVTGYFSVIGLPFLDYETFLKPYNIKTLINYHGE